MLRQFLVCCFEDSMIECQISVIIHAHFRIYRTAAKRNIKLHPLAATVITVTYHHHYPHRRLYDDLNSLPLVNPSLHSHLSSLMTDMLQAV